MCREELTSVQLIPTHQFRGVSSSCPCRMTSFNLKDEQLKLDPTVPSCSSSNCLPSPFALSDLLRLRGSQLARELATNGAAILCLNVPPQTVFSIDCRSYTVGAQFKGIKMIPPGPHYISYWYVFLFSLFFSSPRD